MKVLSKEIYISKADLKLDGLGSLRDYYEKKIKKDFKKSFPVRFFVSFADEKGYHCEVDFIEIENDKEKFFNGKGNIFEYKKRSYENTDKFTAVLLIPTGIGAQIGGYCGDGNVAARLLSSACDVLITHPNVVNASDINEMAENTLYVEGGTLSRFMMGMIGLQKVRSNKVLMIMDRVKDKYFRDEVVNAVSSARVTLGLDCDVLEMEGVLNNSFDYSSCGRATGCARRLEKLFEIIDKNKNGYDALGLTTVIGVPSEFHKKYFEVGGEDMVNPWGGMEAMITHSISEAFSLPCAHSPMSGSMGEMHTDLDLGVVDPRKAPETASITYLHCILKGLFRSPKIVGPDDGLTIKDVSCLIIPDGCIGLPVLSCLENEVPVIFVKNENIMKNDVSRLPFKKGKVFFANNYLEAAGIMTAIKAGVSVESIKRPIEWTRVLK